MLYAPRFYSILLATLVIASAQANERVSTTAEQTDLSLTIYNSHIALVKDARTININPGINTLAFKDISASINPATAMLKSADLTVLEQNFEYDLLTPTTLLNKYIGKTVTVATNNPVTGEVLKSQAIVLANNNGTMLKIGEQIRPLTSNMSLIYDNVPDDLRDKPTLTMVVDNTGETQQAVELTYLTQNLTWQADYVMNLIDDQTLNLKGWVTLDNHSGTNYNNAHLQLVAGDINRVQPESFDNMMAVDKAIMTKAVPAATMAEESLFEYHLYTLGQQTTIKNQQQKQVSLLEAVNVPYEKHLVVIAANPYGWNSWGSDDEYIDLTPHAKLVIDNKKSHHLGIPMPAGIIRSYQNDSQGRSQFIGEDRIDHTPENEQITLQLGEAFDVTAKYKQTNFQQQQITEKTAVKKSHKTEVIASYEVLFKNAKDSEVVVDYRDQFYGDWTISEQSHHSEKQNSQLNQWHIRIPSKGETTLNYTVRMVF